MTSRLSQMPVRCEVIEIRNSADADGFPCSRTASTQCFDCGSELCESHTETCGICNGIFCPSCLSFHSVQHSKPEGRPSLGWFLLSRRPLDRVPPGGSRPVCVVQDAP